MWDMNVSVVLEWLNGLMNKANMIDNLLRNIGVNIPQREY
jgi:hypothetical protein